MERLQNKLVWTSILPLLFRTVLAGRGQVCKAVPGDSNWPAPIEWANLNTTVSGRLIQGVPPGAVCYGSRPEYNVTACNEILPQWIFSGYHASHPISVDYPVWANNSCPPIYPNGTSASGDPDAGKKGCTQGNYPVYAINVTEANDVVAAFKFAKKWNVRLNIKNTGHNVPGRSTAFGSLSIWTHNLKGIKFETDFKSKTCSLGTVGKQWAATVGAGVQDFDLYYELSKHGAVAVGGSNPTVGIVGWFTGGGHGPLSSKYGMGADNLLEAVVVTPSGEVVTANACQHKDLFYAIRGGGGGTYGVILSATVKAFPNPQTTLYSLQILQTDGSKVNEWWDLMAYIHSELPRLKDAGVQGYYGIWGPPISPVLTFWSSLYLYDQPNGTAELLFAPITTRIRNSSFAFYLESSEASNSYFEIWNRTVGVETVAGGFAMGSRLLTRRSLVDNVDGVARTFAEIGPRLDPLRPAFFIGHLIANNQNRGLDIGLNPAWRDAITHFIVIDGWIDGAGPAVIQQVYDDMTYNKTAALQRLDPNSGAYFNEADVFAPNWQKEFFGPNYARLKIIKQKYDPKGLLWCRSCVGSEAWIEGPDKKLCKAS